MTELERLGEPAEQTAPATTAAQRFQAADRRRTAVTVRWNSLPTPEARRASGLAQDLEAADAERRAAVDALLREAAGRHRIDERAGVYLTLGPDRRWQIDPDHTDQEPLYGYEMGPDNQGCQHDNSDLDDECHQVAIAADDLGLPTLTELAGLLLNHLYRPDHARLPELALDSLSDQALDHVNACLDAERRRRTGPAGETGPPDPPASGSSGTLSSVRPDGAR
ncbi:hypothetical protein OWR29_26310 [Actinoplanes sp. Pm04-4]|uniref:Uncharacterized protein n=1 Tax=Paractinoplanes pyxinae TaxID=2997416 RepID=A0ABT4B4X1_9ACTN|nr:hypothetical protein [Actinoplanes pyxinae]MCY1141526.1 hypothetical protein [Actinoplanes pyxinae]